MECVRCGNKDPTFFYKGHKGYYCRKCIGFSRLLLKEDIESIDYEIGEKASEYSFNYELTSRQAEASNRCLEYIKNGDVLLHCVCGAGKTEITVASISEYLARGLKVCYAIARKEVVIELAERFRKIFTSARVVAVYGGHHDIITGDLIICTTHQLYRYYKTFDLLVLDEVDAYPLKGNEVLMNIAINSVVGRIIYSTATVDEGLVKIISKRNYRIVELNVRPSGKPLIVPKVVCLNKYMHIFYLALILHNMTNQCIIFVPSIGMCKSLYKLFSKFVSCTYVYADYDKRNKNINDFKMKKYKFIFATSVLERGVTIKDVNVVILNFGKIFDQANLIQMLGRVGRSIDNPYGEAYILSDHLDRNVIDTMKYLRYVNSFV